jgi:hypothetical protein
MDFEITKEELLEIAAKKLIENLSLDESDLVEYARGQVLETIKTSLAQKVVSEVDSVLKKHMDALLENEIIPVTIWGEKCGNPTTIKAALHERTRDYWNTKVDKNSGNPASDSYYNTITRAEWLASKVAAAEFDGVIKQNLVNIVAAFKDALREDAAKKIDSMLNELLRVKSLKDK